jgi:hypothetical protein
MRCRCWYKIPLFVVLGAALLLGVGYVTMLLWNVLIPALFHGPMLTFWQTIGLLILLKILLHGFGCHRFGRNGWHGRHYNHWKKRFEEKMATMTPEEREKFKEEWRQHCGPGYWKHRHSHDCCDDREPEKKD